MIVIINSSDNGYNKGVTIKSVEGRIHWILIKGKSLVPHKYII